VEEVIGLAGIINGDLEINDRFVMFSDDVGSYVSAEQTSLLYRTAHELGKKAIMDRWPSNINERMSMERQMGGEQHCLEVNRNRHGVPRAYVFKQLTEGL
jgi:hypothetical protein